MIAHIKPRGNKTQRLEDPMESRLMSHGRRTRGARLAGLVAVLIVAAGMCTGAQAQVMDQVPAEAFVVVKCAKLQDTSAKLAKFMHELGVDAFQPELADPLGALQGKMKAQNGVDKNGELAWVFCDPAVAENEPDKSVLVLVPISD